jgi:aminomethyltransferase
MMDSLKRTPLFDTEKNLGAHFVKFSGWEMPVYFESILAEHRAVRESAGLFDVGHMGKIKISGSRSLEFLSRLSANDPALLRPGQIRYSMILNEAGGVKDDILIYRLEKYFLLVVNAVNTEKILGWLNNNNQENVLIEDLTNSLFMLAVQGPAAEKIISEIFGQKIYQIFYYHFVEVELEGQKLVLSRTGYTGEDGFEIIGPNDLGRKIWLRLGSAGSEDGLIPCGLGARDVLRIEAALPLYGQELDENITPLEVGFEWLVKFQKRDFIGKSALLEKKKVGLSRRLAGLIVEEKIIPRGENEIFEKDGETSVGCVSSGTFSPSLDLPVAMAFLKPAQIGIGNIVRILVRGRLVSGRVVQLPFYRHRTKKFKEVNK